MTGAYRTAPTAALSVLAGCVPLEIQARVRYECRARMYEDVRKVRVNERPHPGMRGGMEGEEMNERRIVVWVDAAKDSEGRKACAWLVAPRGRESYVLGIRVEGDLDSNDMEAIAVIKGLKEGIRERGGEGDIQINTDSKYVVEQTKGYRTSSKFINQIQKMMENARKEGFRIGVEWRGRRTNAIRMVDRECKRIMRGDGRVQRIEGIGKNTMRERMNEMEIREWQRSWDEGETERWMRNELWRVVDRNGCEASKEITQALPE